MHTLSIQSTDSDGSSGTRNYTLTTVNSGGGGPLFAEPMLLAGDTLKYDFTYDAQGRMLKKGTQQNYVYDALNRMTQVTGKETYLYDGHGRRVQITKTSDNKKNYPLYSLDGKLLLEDNRQTLTRTEYIYAGGRLVAKKIQPITSTGANTGVVTTTTIHTDFLGSPVAETNASGTVTRVERYTPYGEPSDLQLDVGPGFTGHATDVLTGLTYMQQRYMDQEIGRFLTPDPVGPEEDFVNHFNRYNYAQNNPVRYTDPDGRLSKNNAPAGNTCSKTGSTSCSGAYGQPGGGAGIYTNTASFMGKSGGKKNDGSSNGNEPSFIGFIKEDGMDVVWRALDVYGGLAQIGAGGGACLTGAGCAGGVALIGLGANGVQEGFTGGPGFLREASTSAFGEKWGSFTLDVVNIGSSIKAIFSPVLKPDAWKLFKNLPEDFQPGYKSMTKTGLGVEVITTTNTAVEQAKSIRDDDK